MSNEHVQRYSLVSATSKRWKCGNVQKAGRPCPTSWEALGNELTCVNATQHMHQPRPVAHDRVISLCNRFVMCTGRFRIVAVCSWSVSMLPPVRDNLFPVTCNLIDARDTILDFNSHTQILLFRRCFRRRCLFRSFNGFWFILKNVEWDFWYVKLYMKYLFEYFRFFRSY